MASTLTQLTKSGDSYKNYSLKRIIPLQEIRCILRELEHIPTGATIMHVEADDPENVFCLCLRTTPERSDGVAHILEHTVLCGSENYPVHDPFFSMTRRSLNTFMNAFTGQDFTCYPAASQVRVDFYNLFSIYCDAVFKPKLERFAFQQEGHRLEFDKPDDPKSDLVYKGIVFNEMKGALSSSTARFWEEIGAGLFPDVTYGVNSGGDPSVIPSLTYEELLQFHNDYYHPGRCLYYFYGNLPLEGHLDFLEKTVFDGVKNSGPLPKIPLQKRFQKPVQKTVLFPAALNEATENKSLIGFAWLTCQVLEQQESLALTVLDTILTDTDASPLKKALLRSGLCKEAEMVLVEDVNELPLVIQLRGCNPEDADKLEALIRSTLRQVAEEGISERAIESALHQIELERSEINGDSYPYGLSLFFRAGLLKQHGGQPEEALRIHSLFDELRKNLRKPHYLPSLIERYILDNPHFLRLIMTPDSGVSEREAEAEAAELAKKKAALSAEESESIVKGAGTLVNYQEMHADENLDCLPIIPISEVPKTPRDFKLIHEKLGGCDLHHHDVFTNEIVYADLVYDLPEFAMDELWLVRLFANLLPHVGNGQRDYAATLDLLQEHTGGLDASLSLHPQARAPNKFKPSFTLSGKALHRNAHYFFPLMKDMLCSPDFTDKERLKELLNRHFSGLEQSLVNGALRYATNLSSCAVSSAAVVGKAWSGIDYYERIRTLINNLDTRIDTLVEQLQAMAERILCREQGQLVLATDAKSYESFKKERFWGLLDYTPRFAPLWEPKVAVQEIASQGLIIPATVAFTCLALEGVPYTHPHAAPLCLAAKIANQRTLHKKIREQGGAYGGGSSYGSLSGIFSFYAYRDPNLSKSLAAFRDAAQCLAKGAFSVENTEEAKLEIVQSLDCPISPGGRAHTTFAWEREGLDLDTRQSFRHRLLNCTSREIKKAIEEVVLPQLDKRALVSFAGQELLEREKPLLAKMGLKDFEINTV